MHGLVLTQLREHVVASYGAPTWTSLLHAAGLGGRVYAPSGDVPDEEVGALVAAAAAATGTSPAQVLEGFGRFLAPQLLATYSFLVPADWTAFDVLERTEQTIHTVVRARSKDAHPPVLGATRVGPTRVQIRYESERGLCALARGIALGLGDHYRTPVVVTETTCRQAGGPYCLLDVTGAAVPTPRAEATSRSWAAGAAPLA